MFIQAKETQSVKVWKYQRAKCFWENCFSNLEDALQALRMKEKERLYKKERRLPIKPSKFYLKSNV